MQEVKDKPKMVERAFLVRLYQENAEYNLTLSLTSELNDLVTTLGIEVVGQKILRKKPFQPRFLSGSGQVQDILEEAREVNADCIVFDNELSPSQQRNWEAESKLCVIDRQEVILDIFGQRAQTKEAKLQVQLARLEYTLPRLTRAWDHLGRQGGGTGGGVGNKGEGEQQLELDRRIIRHDIDRVKKELIHVKKVRSTQRKERQKIPIPNAAIVGYTNAGKSSFLRRMTGADVLVADKLFATLDTTTRKITLPNGHPLLLTDTVGFVRNLPHRLVDAFKATLEEAVLADFLIHILDVSSLEVEQFHQTTLDVLEELGADTSRILTVFNKMDICENEIHLQNIKNKFPDAFFISVHSGEGIEPLMEKMAEMLSDRLTQLHLHIPHSRNDLISLLHQNGKVLETEYEAEYIDVRALIPARFANQFEPFELS